MNSDSKKSVWRRKAVEYFGEHDNFTRMSLLPKRSTYKIAVDMTYPISLYLDYTGNCLLYSLDTQFVYKELGSCKLSSAGTVGYNEHPSDIYCLNSMLYVASEKGVTQYSTNCQEVARGQCIDDFVQLALPKQQKPTDLGPPVVTYYSCDAQMESWPQGVHSVIEKSKLEEKGLSLNQAKQALDKMYEQRKREAPFKAEVVTLFKHDAKVELPSLPLTGPTTKGVKKMSFSFRNPKSFQSIAGQQWFDWDIPSQKLKNVGIGDGFQLLSLDTSLLMRDTFALGTHGGNVILHDLRSKEPIQQLSSSNSHRISHVKFSPIIQPLLATSSDDFSIKLWDVRQGFDKPYLTLEGHQAEITGIAFSVHRADFLFTSSYDSTVRVWNINNQYPPHHCLTEFTNEYNLPVTELVSGCHRRDSFYFGLTDGTTGIVKLKKNIFLPVIPHRLQGEEEQEAETLMYFKKNQELFTKVLGKVTSILEKKSDVSPIFPLLDLTITRPFELKDSLATASLEEVISYYSYFLSAAIPQQFLQPSEPHQIADSKRCLLFAKVLGSIQKQDASTLIVEKNNIISALDAFSREDILAMVKVFASSSFEDALEVGTNYLSLLIANNKLEKFLDVGYFLLYPTIYDDPTQPFQVLANISHNARARLRTVLNNDRLTKEIEVYIALLATAANDQDTAISQMYNLMAKHNDTFLSMFLNRVYFSFCLVLGQYPSCIIQASQIAKDVEGFPFKQIIFDFLTNDVMERFSKYVSSTIMAKSIDPASYINAISDVIIIASHAQVLPKEFEELLNNSVALVSDILSKLLKGGESTKLLNQSPLKLALAIRTSLEKHGRTMPQQGVGQRNVNSIFTTINEVVSTYS